MDQLKYFRKKNKFSQKQMAEQLDISYSHYVKIENNFTKPSYELLKKIKDKFDMDMNVFF